MNRNFARQIVSKSRCAFSTAVKFNAVGNPLNVLKLQTSDSLGNLGAKDIKVKILASPINPSDLNMVQGVYGVKPELPAIGGNEGVMRVQEIGTDVKSVKVGDWVLPSASGFGTWREEAQANESSFIKICNNIPVAYAATMAVNPCSAYRMLRDFVVLKPGDVIIQNGANSMVGLAVIQMAREMGVKTINIVRSDRPDAESELRLLTNLGGDINITDEYVNTHGFNEIMKDLPPIKLALNCVGGDVTTQMSRVLGQNATMVTYGGMSKKPVQVPFEVLVYKQLKLKGFWITAWNKEHSIKERQDMLNDVSDMIRSKKLQLFYELHDFDDFNHALSKSMEPFRRRKVVLNMDYPDRLKEHDARAKSDYDVFETSTV